MIVFSKDERTREGPRQAGESQFQYLDSSCRDEAVDARRIIEEWIVDYPAEKLDHWLGDFRSNDDGQHESAFFELFLFQFLQRVGCEIVAVEPDLEGHKETLTFWFEMLMGTNLLSKQYHLIFDLTQQKEVRN